jgi:hypothetical protein
MRFGAQMLRYGEVPPAGGPRRVEFLTRRGRRAVGRGLGLHAEVLDVVGRHVDIDAFPYAHPGAPNEDADLLACARAWDPFRHRLVVALPAEQHAALQQSARSALDSLIDGYRDLRAVDVHDRAHQRMHRVGELVSGLFLCMYRWDAENRVWMDRCPVRHGHNDMGISPGITSRELCSLCDLDAADCDHLPGEIAEIVAGPAGNGTCNICGAGIRCGHVAGETYPAVARVVVTDAVLREGTMLTRSRDPRLRSFEAECMEGHPPPRRGLPPLRRCLACLVACDDRLPGGGSATGG